MVGIIAVKVEVSCDNVACWIFVIKSFFKLLTTNIHAGEIFVVLPRHKNNQINKEVKIWKQFNDFYSSRNSYLHGPIPAHKFVDGLIKIPTPAGRVAVGSKWTDESRWTDSNRFSFEFVSDFFRHTTKEAIELTRSGISQCLTRLKELEPDLTTPLQRSEEHTSQLQSH